MAMIKNINKNNILWKENLYQDRLEAQKQSSQCSHGSEAEPVSFALGSHLKTHFIYGMLKLSEPHMPHQQTRRGEAAWQNYTQHLDKAASSQQALSIHWVTYQGNIVFSHHVEKYDDLGKKSFSKKNERLIFLYFYCTFIFLLALIWMSFLVISPALC